MAKEVKIGAKAPAVTMTLDDGKPFNLKDFQGKKVVLYFYPKDDTPGCTKEAVAFSGELAKFKRAGAVVIGVSRDSVAKHLKFKEKHGLKIPLGADENGKVTEDFGVWVEKSMYGRQYMGIERATFLIDEKGVVREIWRKVKVAGHAEEVLQAVKAL
ncbi:thioredoxin-dependent thiol peroxidase [Hyphococcus sp.]|uniref:thioredoxin-dependent thiol peroxidase n=1 Tax=Hyphococcus sp. TaxID=2038636 RepID=UPI002087C5C9|nr:MAG: peroxiredoxin [Marinicaulis sp.]